MNDRDRDIFIALIDAGLDESAVLSFIEGDTASAAGVVEALAKDAALAELVWQLRADRDAIREDALEQPMPAATQAMVSAVLDQVISEEIDAGEIRRIEETGRARREIVKPVHKVAKPRRARRHRSLRLPSRTTRIVTSLGVAAIIVLLVSVALPNIDLGTTNRTPSNTQIAQGDAPDQGTSDSGTRNSVDRERSPNDAIADLSDQRERPRYRPSTGPISVDSAHDALALARQGRLIVRLTSARTSTISSLDEHLTTGGDLARFAIVEGRAKPEQALAFDQSLPVSEQPVIAGDAKTTPEEGRLEAPRQRVGSYMLRVESTERAFTLLLAKLKTYPGVSIELIGSPEAVTTPGSTSDLIDLSKSPTNWQSRIAVPVVVDSVR